MRAYPVIEFDYFGKNRRGANPRMGYLLLSLVLIFQTGIPFFQAQAKGTKSDPVESQDGDDNEGEEGRTIPGSDEENNELPPAKVRGDTLDDTNFGFLGNPKPLVEVGSRHIRDSESGKWDHQPTATVRVALMAQKSQTGDLQLGWFDIQYLPDEEGAPRSVVRRNMRYRPVLMKADFQAFCQGKHEKKKNLVFASSFKPKQMCKDNEGSGLALKGKVGDFLSDHKRDRLVIDWVNVEVAYDVLRNFNTPAHHDRGLVFHTGPNFRSVLRGAEKFKRSGNSEYLHFPKFLVQWEAGAEFWYRSWNQRWEVRGEVDTGFTVWDPLDYRVNGKLEFMYHILARQAEKPGGANVVLSWGLKGECFYNSEPAHSLGRYDSAHHPFGCAGSTFLRGDFDTRSE